jgi:hypothetical protein
MLPPPEPEAAAEGFDRERLAAAADKWTKNASAIAHRIVCEHPADEFPVTSGLRTTAAFLAVHGKFFTASIGSFPRESESYCAYSQHI